MRLAQHRCWLQMSQASRHGRYSPSASRGRGRAAGPAAAARAAVAGRGHHALRMRRPDRLPPAAAGGGAARDRGPGGRRAAACHRLQVPVVARGAGTGLSGGACRTPGRDAGAGQVQPDRAGRPAGAHGHRAVRRAQPGHQRSRGAPRPVLRARPQQPDRLHHRRQRGRKQRRRALPEVRPDAAQRAARARLHGRGRGGGVRQRPRWTRRAWTCCRPSWAAKACWP
jgi:hypothetical protein